MQARQTHKAETSFSAYGLVIHLQLLPTPPRGDAVTFGYRQLAPVWSGLTPLWLNALEGAHSHGHARGPYHYNSIRS